MTVEPQRDLFGNNREMPRRRWYRSVPVPEPRKPLFPEPSGEMGKLELAFWKFHKDHPEVYRLLVKFSLEWREARGKDAQLGMKALFERVRWERYMDMKDEEGWKLNNNYTAFYARLLMESDSRLKGLFQLRRQRLPATIGPDGKEGS